MLQDSQEAEWSRQKKVIGGECREVKGIQLYQRIKYLGIDLSREVKGAL